MTSLAFYPTRCSVKVPWLCNEFTNHYTTLSWLLQCSTGQRSMLLGSENEDSLLLSARTL